MKTRIHLVRHATSESNLDLSVNRRKPDHAIELAPYGHDQAKEAGRFMAEHVMGGVGGFHHRRVRFYISPYVRTRQTKDGFADAFSRMGIEFDEREEGLIREQSFGLLDGIPHDELPSVYPAEWEHYQKHVRFAGEFFAPMPLGESRAMVCDRVRGCFGTILRDMSGKHMPPITDAFVFTHGVTQRCFRKEWLHRPWEFVENEPNPNNCSVVTIEGESGKGWKERQTFEGFDRHAAPEQEHREEGHA